MLETSKDLLNIMMGSSVLLVALLFSWLLYQTARTLKGVNDTIKVIQNIIGNIDEGVTTFKSKAGNAAAFLTVFIKSAQSILTTIDQKKTRKKSRKKSRKK
ncbi:MAG: hypothetical protein HOE19_04315 [Candidatus Komeilibacteria bacterium]|jgi:hypothetical protein|nr:hypothetical protein [Candidatus Komeilibacteria bacterium]MBT4447898.1 hypothetical protein [Candidatus Komeilibacteria bacterium]